MVVKNKYLVMTLKAILLNIRIHPVMELKPLIRVLDGFCIYQNVFTETLMLSNAILRFTVLVNNILSKSLLLLNATDSGRMLC
jgi:hypothetical protein